MLCAGTRSSLFKRFTTCASLLNVRRELHPNENCKPWIAVQPI